MNEVTTLQSSTIEYLAERHNELCTKVAELRSAHLAAEVELEHVQSLLNAHEVEAGIHNNNAI